MAEVVHDRPRLSKVSFSEIAGHPSTHLYHQNSFRLVFLSLALSTSLSALDQTIVATALQTIRDDFLDSSIYSWVGGAYLLSSAVSDGTCADKRAQLTHTLTQCLAPLYGSLANVLGRRITFLGALALFTLG